MTDKNEQLEKIYGILSGEDAEDRSCKAIPDEACKHEPRNYILNISNGTATKLAEQLAGPKLVLPWLMSAIGAPAFLIGFLMPIKQTGSLLPQLAVAGQLRKFSVRKWFWVGAGITQTVMLLLMIAATAFLTPLWAGISIVVLLVLFSTASGVGSVAFQDVVGKTIDKGVRGKMLAYRATFGGILTIIAGILLKTEIKGAQDLSIYYLLLFIAAGLWAFGALMFGLKKEYPGASDGGKNAIEETSEGMKYYREQKGYRQYLFTRAALLSIEIATPFYVIHSQKLLSDSIESMSIFVVALGIAQILSNPFWGKFADVSSKKVMIISGLMGAGAGTLALLFSFVPGSWQTPYLYGLIFILLGFAEAGVRLGRKTYLIDAAPEKERPTYVAFANSTIGVVTIIMGGLGLIVQYFSVEVLIFVLIALGLTGTILSFVMPEVDNMVR